MYRKILPLIILIIYLIGSVYVFESRDPGNTSWAILLILPILYYLIFGLICSFVIGVEYNIIEDKFMIIIGIISLYFVLIPIIYYSPIKLLSGVESFFMINKSAGSIARLITVLFGIIVGGFIKGWINGSRSQASVQDIT